MQISVSLIRKLEQIDPPLRDVLFAILEEMDRQREETVTKKEFNELKEIVRELAEAQKRTELRVEELAEAQKRTELRVEELAEAQKRTELKVEELAEAQRETQRELRKLVGEHVKTREQVGGLSTTVGYVLENEAMKALPALLESEFGLRTRERLVRKFVEDELGRPIEVNILGKAARNGQEVVILGEAKSQLSKQKVVEFLNKKVKPLVGVLKAEVFPILVTHMISSPDVVEYALQKGIKRIYYSYEFS